MITVTQEIVYGPPPGIRLTITSSTSVQDFQVWRIHADGSEHRVLTETGQRIVGGAAVVTDYCAPYNEPLTYRVDADQSASVEAWLPCDETWLIHPAVPSLSVAAKAVQSISSRARASRAAEFWPQGSDPVYRSDEKRAGITGSIVLLISSDKELAVDALIDDNSVLLINTPGLPGWDLKWLWAELGVEFGNPTGWRGTHDRTVALGFKKAADPDVDQTPVWTCDIAIQTWALSGVTTCDQVATHYATALDAQIDKRL